MAIMVPTPSIHGVSDISAQARVINGTQGDFTTLRLTFTGPDGSKHEQDIYFDSGASSRAFDIEHAINAGADA